MATNAVYSPLDNIKHPFERFFPSIHFNKYVTDGYRKLTFQVLNSSFLQHEIIKQTRATQNYTLLEINSNLEIPNSLLQLFRLAHC